MDFFIQLALVIIILGTSLAIMTFFKTPYEDMFAFMSGIIGILHAFNFLSDIFLVFGILLFSYCVYALIWGTV